MTSSSEIVNGLVCSYLYTGGPAARDRGKLGQVIQSQPTCFVLYFSCSTEPSLLSLGRIQQTGAALAEAAGRMRLFLSSNNGPIKGKAGRSVGRLVGLSAREARSCVYVLQIEWQRKRRREMMATGGLLLRCLIWTLKAPYLLSRQYIKVCVPPTKLSSQVDPL